MTYCISLGTLISHSHLAINYNRQSFERPNRLLLRFLNSICNVLSCGVLSLALGLFVIRLQLELTDPFWWL